MMRCLLFLYVFFFAGMASGHSGRGKLSSELKKECKRQVRQLTEEGWKVYTRDETLEEAFGRFYFQMSENPNCMETLIASGTGTDENMALRKARHHAAVQYAVMTESNVESEAVAQISNRQEREGTRSETNFSVTSQARSEQKVKTLTPSLTISRTLRDGTVEIKMFYLVNK